MDVGVTTMRPPSAFDLQPVLLQGEQERRDRCVQLGSEPDGVELEAADGMMGLSPQQRVEVVDDLHRARVQRCCAGRLR